MKIEIKPKDERQAFLLRLKPQHKQIIALGATLKGVSEQKLITDYGINNVIDKLLDEFPQLKELKK